VLQELLQSAADDFKQFKVSPTLTLQLLFHMSKQNHCRLNCNWQVLPSKPINSLLVFWKTYSAYLKFLLIFKAQQLMKYVQMNTAKNFHA